MNEARKNNGISIRRFNQDRMKNKIVNVIDANVDYKELKSGDTTINRV